MTADLPVLLVKILINSILHKLGIGLGQRWIYNFTTILRHFKGWWHVDWVSQTNELERTPWSRLVCGKWTELEVGQPGIICGVLFESYYKGLIVISEKFYIKLMPTDHRKLLPQGSPIANAMPVIWVSKGVLARWLVHVCDSGTKQVPVYYVTHIDWLAPVWTVLFIYNIFLRQNMTLPPVKSFYAFAPKHEWFCKEEILYHCEILHLLDSVWIVFIVNYHAYLGSLCLSLSLLHNVPQKMFLIWPNCHDQQWTTFPHSANLVKHPTQARNCNCCYTFCSNMI